MSKMKYIARLVLPISVCLTTFVPTVTFAQVKVGVINSMSGTFAEFGRRYLTGLEVARDEINDNGGINGEQVELVLQDDASQAQGALAAFESMNNDELPMVIGTYASSISGPLAKLADRSKRPLLILGSADDGITNPGSPWVFRAKHESSIVAQVYFDYYDHLRESDPELKTIAILVANSAWPNSLAKKGREHAEERGYEIVADQAYNQGTTDFRPILNKFKKAKPDIIYSSTYASDGVAVARQIREVGLDAKVVTIDTSSSLPSFVNQLGDASEYITSAVTWNQDVNYPGADELAKALGERAGGDPSFYEAEGYLNLRVAADALSRAASMEPEDVRQALLETDLMTPAGHVKFEDKDGFQNQNPIQDLIIQIQEGEHVTVFPPDLAAADSVYPIPSWKER